MKEKIFMIIFVLILGTFFTTLLVSVNNYTKPIIKRNTEIKIKASILDALGIPYSKDNIEKVFNDNVKLTTKSDKTFYVSQDNEVAFEISGSGLWGPIEAVIAFKSDLKTIKGITIIYQEETPGLGGRIAEKEYLSKFVNKTIFPEFKIVPSGKAKKDNEVDGITGATITSKAFEKLINTEARKYIAIFGGDKK